MTSRGDEKRAWGWSGNEFFKNERDVTPGTATDCAGTSVRKSAAAAPQQKEEEEIEAWETAQERERKRGICACGVATGVGLAHGLSTTMPMALVSSWGLPVGCDIHLSAQCCADFCFPLILALSAESLVSRLPSASKCWRSCALVWVRTRAVCRGRRTLNVYRAKVSYW